MATVQESSLQENASSPKVKRDEESALAPPPQVALLDDDPCWGGPQHCRLSDLLSLVDKSRVVLREALDYMVVCKPPDLRMDGPYRATLHKLLTYWYPPPSLLKQGFSSNLDLVQYIESNLHKTNDLPDNELRHVHQLDYATSGVLLVARSSSAAATACDSFQRRLATVRKQYLAVVHGELKVNSQSWPLITRSALEDFARHEATYRRERSKPRGGEDTFEGFLPHHSIFQQWKSYMLKLTKTTKTPKKIKRGPCINVLELWKQVTASQYNITAEEEVTLTTLNWKSIKRNDVWRSAFEALAGRYNEELRKIQQQQEVAGPNKHTRLPRLFRVEGEPDNVFYMCAALAQVPNEFAMRMESTTKDENGTSGLDFKPSLTRCVIIHSGMLKDSESSSVVTKLQLEPKTGRRHQLRIHLAQVAGHAIVGDVTYQDPSHDKVAAPRMCLHAHQLCLPPLLPDTVTAPDPFPVDVTSRRIEINTF